MPITLDNTPPHTYSEACMMMDPVEGFSEDVATSMGLALPKGYTAAYASVYYTAIVVGFLGLISLFPLRSYEHEFAGNVPRRIYRGRWPKIRRDRQRTVQEPCICKLTKSCRASLQNLENTPMEDSCSIWQPWHYFCIILSRQTSVIHKTYRSL